MKVAIGCDHGGINLKPVLTDYLEKKGIEYVEIIGDAACGGICLDYVGEAIPLREAELGDDLPPYHPNCACSFCAYEEFVENSDDE